jgi:septal ring factor EnvC (AmiA/AmiB activator)
MGWKEFKEAWTEHKNSLSNIALLQEDIAQLETELWDVRRELQAHKERVDRLNAAIEQRLDRIEGIR